MRAGSSRRVALCVALCGVACAPPPPPAEPASTESRPGDFSEERAGRHLEALVSIGSRPPGSDGSRRAREYLAGALRELDVEVKEQTARSEVGSPAAVVETVNLFATIPGASPDPLLLVAPYDAPTPASDGASGPALLLELARSLRERHPPYTLWLAFVEGDGLGAQRPGDPGALVGTSSLIAGFGERLASVRVAVYFDRVAEPDLRVARDLLSNRTLREQFWASARRLGLEAVFPPDAGFESVDAGQRAFFAAGMRRAVAISGVRKPALSQTTSGEPEAPGGEPAAEAGPPSAASLAAVGAVSLDALVSISGRLAKIDRFVESPVTASESEGEAAPDSDAAVAQ